MSQELDELNRALERLAQSEQREVLEFALALSRKRGCRTTSFLDVPDPMPADEAEQFSRRIEEAFETVEPDA